MSQKEPRTSLFTWIWSCKSETWTTNDQEKNGNAPLVIAGQRFDLNVVGRNCVSHDDPNANWNHLERNANNLLVVILSTCLKFEHIAWNYIWQFNHKGTNAPLIIINNIVVVETTWRTLQTQNSSLHLISGRKYSGLGAEIWASLVDVTNTHRIHVYGILDLHFGWIFMVNVGNIFHTWSNIWDMI